MVCWMIFGWPLSQPFALYPPFTFSSLSCPACPLQPVPKSLSCNFVGPRRPFCPQAKQAKQAPLGQGKEGTQARKAYFSTMAQYWPTNCTLHCYFVKCKWIDKKKWNLFYGSNIFLLHQQLFSHPLIEVLFVSMWQCILWGKGAFCGAIFFIFRKIRKNRHTFFYGYIGIRVCWQSLFSKSKLSLAKKVTCNILSVVYTFQCKVVCKDRMCNVPGSVQVGVQNSDRSFNSAEVEPSPCPVVRAAKSTMSQIPSHVILSWFQGGDVGEQKYMRELCLRYNACMYVKVLIVISTRTRGDSGAGQHMWTQARSEGALFLGDGPSLWVQLMWADDR